MEEEYKSKICISCINKVCNGSIEKTKKRKYNNSKMRDVQEK